MTHFDRILLYVTAAVVWFVMLAPDEITGRAIAQMLENLNHD